ncbi:hypothetical protein [Rosistilla oblonga]|uniref:Uncharacterized protein n=1 Tax=Rosistilla oblonga TaxID=2527990 RepID=A0A518IXS4_9BACT|nr:hypothetical protein [Rosistilla oblonga]QDV57877.1 hypothetical protein Mal33_38920 [Rosistilla oblonga]
MPLIVKCPGCQQPIKIAESARGKKVKCPGCSQVLAIAAPKTNPAEAETASRIDAAQTGSLKLPPAKPKPLQLPSPERQEAAFKTPDGTQATLALPAAKRSSGTPSSTSRSNNTIAKCTTCAQSLKLSPQLAGKKVKCPKCATIFVVPAKREPSPAVTQRPTNPSPVVQAAASQTFTAQTTPGNDAALDEVDLVDDTGFAADSPGFDFGDAAFDTATAGTPSSDDPFASDAFSTSTVANGFGAPAGQSGFQAATPQPAAPLSGPHFAIPAPAKPQPSATAKSKATNDAVVQGLVYRMPAMLGIACASLNLLIVLVATVIGCIGWFPRIKVIGLILFAAGSTIGAQVYAINGFIGVINMSDRHGGIHAAKGILACPFITAIVLAIGLGPMGMFLAGGIWVFMLLYNWPLGWWLWLMLEKKEAGRAFNEVDRDDVDLSSLMTKKPDAATAAPAWSPVGVPVAKPEETQAAKPPMSPETKLKLMLGGGALAALLLFGGVVGIGVMMFAGSRDVAEAAPPPEGWYVAKATGVSMFFPSEPIEPEMGIGDMECWTTYSENTESFFLLAAAPSGSQLSLDGLMKNTARRLGGDVLGHREITRGPMTGMTGSLSVSFKFPDMPVEAYQHEGRTVIIGYVAGSTLNSRGGGDITAPPASPEEERKEKEIFFDSIHFAPPGFFGY